MKLEPKLPTAVWASPIKRKLQLGGLLLRRFQGAWYLEEGEGSGVKDLRLGEFGVPAVWNGSELSV